MDERAESPLGQLALRRVISEEEYEAGLRYAAVVDEYRTVIEAPRQVVVSGPGFACWADAVCTSDPGICICRMRRVRYDMAYTALWDAGQQAAKVVARVAIHREEVVAADIGYLRLGLSALARHFGLTGRKGAGRILKFTLN